ncbi:MAG: hypothetical protein ABR921_09910 [Candidatus Sulfotelmatobacter sp.]|jgi:hypothetical protein
MKFSVAGILLAVLTATLSGIGDSRPSSESLAGSVAIYDPDPSHIWNRLHATFFVREDLPETAMLPDALDPPFWYHTRYLLAQPSHKNALRILDEFLETHAESLIRDPVKRAILQRDLWAVFDWSAGRAPGSEEEKRELQGRLGEVLHHLALTPEQLGSLPDNYAQAVASGAFAKEYDPEHRDRAFLPPDLFEAQGSWVELDGRGKPLPVAEQHDSFFSGRSSFLVFLRLPGGRKATFDYLKTLWNSPMRLAPSPPFSPLQDEAANPDLPQLPAGTQVALVRQMTLFDNQGKLAATSITESVQIRVYRSVAPSIAPAVGIDQMITKSGQDSYAIRLSRPLLFSNQSGGLKAARPDERDFALFGGGGPDEGSPGHYALLATYHPVVKACVMCHREVGLQSLRTLGRLQKPNPLQQELPVETYGPRWWQDARVLSWKQSQNDWRLLGGYLKSAP